MISPLRAGQCLGLAALALVALSDGLQTAAADGDTRTITLRHTHRDDTITVTFKRNGKYDEDGLKQLNHFLRDWRNDKEITMDPKLFDIVWEVYRDVGGKEPIEIISAYRSPETNAWLRMHSAGVAQFSQHMLGKAMDFYIPGVPLEELRYAGLRLQRGGVGFYPSSGSPFVHLDTGSVRHWPVMPAPLLAKVMATKPTQVAQVAAPDRRRMPTDEADEDENEPARTTTASATPKPAQPAKPVAAAPNARQAFGLASASSTPLSLKPAPRAEAPAPAADSDTNVQSWLADIDQAPAAKDRVSPDVALSYATAAAAERERTASASVTARVAPPVAGPAARAAVVARPKPGQRDDDPWLRTLTLVESVHGTSVSSYNEFDEAAVRALMRKPETTIELSFCDDPYDGMTSTEFAGPAVAFLTVVPFSGLTERQANLR